MKLQLLSGAAAVALCAGAGVGEAQAQAQTAGLTEPIATACQNVLCREPPAIVATATGAGAVDEGLGEDGVYLEAETLTEESDPARAGGARVYVARGAVEARYQGRTVRADEVVYQRTTGVVTARGNAVLINADGSVQYADEVQLDEGLSAGVALGFATRLPGQNGAPSTAKIAAASAVRRSERVTELNRAIYTPCDICTPDGQNKEPTFAIQAERITRDTDLGAIVYRNATLRVLGVPVAYTPYFAHPDPTIERRSGFLAPSIGLSDRRGLSYEQPYLWVISPSQDLIVRPQLNTKVNPFLETEYRKRFYSGQVEARFGYTYERDFNEEGRLDGRDVTGDGRPDFSDLTSRSFVLARGRFDITPDWRWGFAAERASDDLIFDKYGVDDVYETRGLYEPDNRRLLTQLYTAYQTPLTYVSAAFMAFQGLRQNDDDGAFPVVAPLIEARWEPQRARARGPTSGPGFGGGAAARRGPAPAPQRPTEVSAAQRRAWPRRG
jgi:LPS-assembly protein